MQKIIVTQTATEIKLDSLQGNEIVAYRSQNSENYCILARLTKKEDGHNQKFGFVAMNCSNSSPRFAEKTWYDSIRLASKTRSIVTFANMTELLTAMLNKTF